MSCSKDGDASIIGTASTSDGAVLEGITVKLSTLDNELVEQVQTDSDGNFSFTGLDADNYYIGATITVDTEVWDTGNKPIMVYVSGEIIKEVALSLNAK